MPVHIEQFRNFFTTEEVVLPYSGKDFYVECCLNGEKLPTVSKFKSNTHTVDPEAVATVRSLLQSAAIGDAVSVNVEFLTPYAKEMFGTRASRFKGKYTKVAENCWFYEDIL